MFDSGILRLIDKNPEKGMALLMEQYTPLVYTIVNNTLSRMLSAQDIEEVVSDVFITFYNQRECFNPDKGSLKAYLTTIARRKAIDKLRAYRNTDAISIDDEDCYIEISDNINIENEVQRREFNKVLIREIDLLGEPDRAIVYRRYFLQENSAQIAQCLDMTDDNVRKRLSRALKKLQLRLKGDYYED